MNKSTTNKSFNNYWKKRLAAKKLYSGLRKIWCPCLNDFVVCNTQGFTHLIRKNGSLRSKKEQLRRFGLLKFLEGIITRASDIKMYRVENNNSQKEVHYWGLEEKINNNLITVVIRKIGNGQKHFFSIMNKKIFCSH